MTRWRFTFFLFAYMALGITFAAAWSISIHKHTKTFTDYWHEVRS